jgi:hypothetical protein
MQERYLGDSHDFVKYALLRHLAKVLNLTIGVNWYLTRPQDVDKASSKDGEKRFHLNGKKWQSWNPKLFELIEGFDAPSNRTIKRLGESDILPKPTVYFSRLLSPATDRAKWHQDAITTLTKAKLIFLDPDNGFEVPSMKPRTAPKYALYAEAADYFNKNKIVVGIQFARQRSPIKLANEVVGKLRRHALNSASLPVIRGRVSPNILFFILSRPTHAKKIRQALSSFANCSPRLDRNKGQRIELIE